MMKSKTDLCSKSQQKVLLSVIESGRAHYLYAERKDTGDVRAARRLVRAFDAETARARHRTETKFSKAKAAARIAVYFQTSAKAVAAVEKFRRDFPRAFK